MNLPNVLTGFRFLLVPVFLYCLVEGYTRYALAAFVMAGLTDAVDGAVARMTGTVTELGAFLDPLADKLLTAPAFIALTLMGRVPVWLTVLVLTKDAIVVIGSIAVYRAGHGAHISPTAAGKANTFVLLSLLTLTLACMVLDVESPYLVYLAWVAAAFTTVSGVQYVRRGLKLAKEVYGGRPK